jgi:hypothetical protein
VHDRLGPEWMAEADDLELTRKLPLEMVICAS